MDPSPFAWYVVDFPISISEHGDRVAAFVSSNDNCERRCNQWLLIKHVDTDAVEVSLPLMDREISSKMGRTCLDDTWATCPHKQEVERRIEAANAVLAKDRWRQLPCYYESEERQRIGPGCEQFRQLEVRFHSPHLIVSQQGRVLLNRSVPAWVWRDPDCGHPSTGIDYYALDPKTGILVVGIWYWAGGEGCAVPRWDFHPIRLPALRRKAPQDRRGGAP